ncbi:MAG: hypothetical protein HON70_44905, partial [Lentisphaerae bacterium]|nr:hypothetical protein [Lentisphaerota bacterium]
MSRRWLHSGLVFVALAAAGVDPVRYEAEDCVVNREAFVKDVFPPDKWTLWSTDHDAHKKWSGGVVLKTPHVGADRATPEEGAPPLHLRVRDISPGTYDVRLRTARALAVSDDGKAWRRLEGEFLARDKRIEDGTLQFWLDDRYAMEEPKHRGSSYIDWIELERSTTQVRGVWNGDFELTSNDKVAGWALPNVSEAHRAQVTHDTVRSGRNAVHLRVQDKPGTRWTVSCTRAIAVRPGTSLRVSVWAQGALDSVAYIRWDGYKNGKRTHYFTGRALIEPSSTWTEAVGYFRVQEDVDELRGGIMGYGPADIVFDDIALEEGVASKPSGRKVNGWAGTRIRETLDRGVIALRTSQGAYVSWRLLDSDPAAVAFDVLRSTDGGASVKINQKPITQTCDISDPGVPDTGRVGYRVVPHGDAASAGEAVLTETAKGAPYIRIPLKEPTTRISRVAVGDLDGDGAYDFVVRHPRASIDPGTSYWRPSEDTYKLEAYAHDGTYLWTRDLGWSIETGIWFLPFVVCDVNGDGRAEVIAKTGEGDPRSPDGKVVSGPEWLTVMDGLSGEDLCRAPWPARKGFASHNLAARNQLAVAYLDGRTPCIIALRGTYGRMKAEAYQMHDGALKALWQYDNAVYSNDYWGQGAHTTRAADMDGDGRDEVLLGSVCLDDDGTPLWNIGRGHPDGCHLGDVLLSRSGLEVSYCMETPQKTDGGLSLVDAATGEFIWKLGVPTRHVHSTGMCADLDPAVPGRECYGADTDEKKRSNRGWLFSAEGDVLQSGVIYGATMPTIFWDGDLQREVLRGRIFDHGGEAHEARIGRGKVVDIIGDWREEVIASAPGELRIYSTTIPAMDRRVCFMQDPLYRACVRMSSMGYEISPTPTVPPAASSPNVNLTVAKTGRELACRVTVSAPLQAPLTGTLTLRVEGNAGLAQDRIAVDLSPGGVLSRTVPLTCALDTTLQALILGELTTKTTVLRAQVVAQGT